MGHNIHIPMPGHTIGDSMKEQTLESIANIEKLVQEHDVIFLLTDSRESRWLPTLLGAAKDKVCLNIFYVFHLNIKQSIFSIPGRLL